MVLPDGRILGYAEYGPSTGRPLMWFHGFPSSRLEGTGLLDSILFKLNLRAICPDRPGFGLSMFQTNRKITDWPADVSALAAHLHLSRFAVIGGSGGGPYALACARHLPKEMVSVVGVLAGAPPWEAGRHLMPWWSRWSNTAAVYAPRVSRWFYDMIIWASKKLLDTRSATVRIDSYLERTPSKSREILSLEERRQALLAILFEAFAQGSTAMVQELLLLSQHWGIKYEDITHDKIIIAHGAKDINAPIEMIQYLVNRLPQCEFMVFDECSHWNMHEHLEEMLLSIMSKGDLGQPEDAQAVISA